MGVPSFPKALACGRTPSLGSPLIRSQKESAVVHVLCHFGTSPGLLTSLTSVSLRDPGRAYRNFGSSEPIGDTSFG